MSFEVHDVHCHWTASPVLGVTLSSCLCLLQHLHEGEDLCVAYKQGLGGTDGLSLIGASLEQLHCAIPYETLMVNLSLEVLDLPILLGVCAGKGVGGRRYSLQ